jgi:hypothetical protein
MLLSRRLAAAALTLFVAASATVPALALGPRNPADTLASVPVDDYAYDHAKRCKKRPARGTVALQRWLEANARGVSWGIMRCQRLSRKSFSLHSEGRALDWHLDVRDRGDRREAKRLIALLLATDRLGNRHALARRMGIQEIIWNCRSWWSGADRMGRYSLCFDRRGRPVKVGRTLAHRDHIHFGLSKRGARMRTTFWKRRG